MSALSSLRKLAFVLMGGMSLALMVMTAILSSYTFLGRSLARLVNQQSLQSEARRALAYFAQDVRMASGLTDTANLSATRVSLTLPTGTGTNTNTTACPTKIPEST